MPSSTKKIAFISIADYLLGEPLSEIKHEYVEGQIYAMAGAGLKHNLINTNLLSLLWNHLKGQPCFPLSGDMLIKTAANRYRYPDIVVVCEDDPSDKDTVRESPLLIIEILSKSTRKKDKGEKRKEYLSLPSLEEYVLIEQDFAEIEVQRKSEGWRPSFYTLGENIVLESVDALFSVEEIYERVDNADIRAFLQQKIEGKD